jgi:hypothetical protein
MMTHADFVVPLTLSCLKTLTKNYQTRFVEDLNLEVKTKDIARGFNEIANAVTKTKYHDVELVLIYHNWHDTIEDAIRKTNYKRGVPTTIYSTNWIKLTSRIKYVDGGLTIPIKCRNIVTELLIVATCEKVGTNTGVNDLIQSLKSDYTTSIDRNFVYEMELVGSGKSIWKARNVELMGPDSADYDLTDRRIAGGDVGYGGFHSKNSVPTDYALVGSKGFRNSNTGLVRYVWHAGGEATQGGVEYGFGDNMACLRFGFQTSDEFYTGGIAMQTINNPYISIKHLNDESIFTSKKVHFTIYAKHGSMIRIDTNTGSIRRTLDV